MESQLYVVRSGVGVFLIVYLELLLLLLVGSGDCDLIVNVRNEVRANYN
jgi:hypothetical protein